MQNVTFGGSLIRDISGLPGLLGEFIHVSRSYPKTKFKAATRQMASAFGHTNAETVVDDIGESWPPNSLLHLGSDGVDMGKTVKMVHKFLPIGKLYSAVSFGFFDAGKPF